MCFFLGLVAGFLLASLGFYGLVLRAERRLRQAPRELEEERRDVLPFRRPPA